MSGDQRSDDQSARSIAEYDGLVDGPEARKRLEKEQPGLVAARDQAVVEQKRERIQQELAKAIRGADDDTIDGDDYDSGTHFFFNLNATFGITLVKLQLPVRSP